MIQCMQICFLFFCSENFPLTVMHRNGPFHSCFWAGAETKNLRMEKITLRNLRCSVLFWQCNVQCDTMQWNAIQCNAMHPCNVQCAVWCNAMLTFNVAPNLSSSSPAWINLRRNINFLQQLEIFTSATSTSFTAAQKFNFLQQWHTPLFWGLCKNIVDSTHLWFYFHQIFVRRKLNCLKQIQLKSLGWFNLLLVSFKICFLKFGSLFQALLNTPTKNIHNQYNCRVCFGNLSFLSCLWFTRETTRHNISLLFHMLAWLLPVNLNNTSDCVIDHKVKGAVGEGVWGTNLHQNVLELAKG